MEDPNFKPLVDEAWQLEVSSCAMYRLVNKPKILKGKLKVLSKDKYTNLQQQKGATWQHLVQVKT